MMGSSCRGIVPIQYVENGTGCRTAGIAAPPLLTSGAARCEGELHGCGISPVCLFDAIAAVFQLYHGGDMMYYEMRRRKPEPTLLQTRGIFNLSRHIGMV